MGTIGILNVGAGDTKLTFDKNNPAECIRAGRIVTDMLRRGYALLVEFEEGGVKKTRRVHEFDENTCEYIIADFDPIVAAEHDQQEEQEHAEVQGAQAESAPREPAAGKRRVSKKRLAAVSTSGVAVARTAGG